MKTISSLSLAAALLLSAVAFAQTPQPSDANSSDVSQSNSPAIDTPSKATDANQSAPEAVSQAYMKQASDKKLTGDDQAQFVDKCKKGKDDPPGPLTDRNSTRETPEPSYLAARGRTARSFHKHPSFRGPAYSQTGAFKYSTQIALSVARTRGGGQLLQNCSVQRVRSA
jgi:hypothetical protein